MGDWKVTGASANTTGGGSTPTPGDITLGTPTLVAVRSFGVPYVKIQIPYTPPSTLNGFDRVHTYLQAPDDAVDAKAAISTGAPPASKGFRIKADSASITDSISRVVPNQDAIDVGVTVDDPKERVITFVRPMPQTAEYWRAYCAPGSKDVEPVLVKGDGPGATPSVRFQVDPAQLETLNAGLEYVPVAASFTTIGAFPRYGNQDGGDPWYGFDVQWTDKVTDPRFPDLGGYQVYIEYPDGRREPNSGQMPLSRHTFTSDRWSQSDTVEDFTLWLVSWRKIDGQENTIIPGVTPTLKMTVRPQRGTAGQEYTGLTTVTGVVQNYITDAQGQKALRLTILGQTANVNGYGGYQAWIIRKYGTGAATHHALTGTGETIFPVESWIEDFPQTDEPAALYALSVDSNGRVNTYDAGVTPLYTFTLGAPTTGGPGVEYAPLIIPPGSSSLVTITTLSTDDGTTMLKAVSNYTNPTGPEYGGAGIVGHKPPYGVNDFVLIGEEREPGAAHYLKGPAAIETWRVYVRSRDVNGRYNSIVFGTTPRQDISVGNATGKLDLTKADVSKYNINEFWTNPTSGVFEQKVISADKIQTGTLLVGGYISGTQTPRPGQMLVTDNTGTAVMWVGQNGTDYGLWAKRGGFGGNDLSTAKVKFLSDGSAIIDGATFRLNLNQTTVTISNTFDGTAGTYIGIMVRTDAVADAFEASGALTARSVGLRQKRSGVDTNFAYLVVSGSGTSADGQLALNEGDLLRSIDLRAKVCRLLLSSESGSATLNGLFQTLSFNGNQVLTVRQSAVTMPFGGTTVDTQARQAISDLYDRLRAGTGHGLLS
jgi:hypothetical protein